MAELSDFAANHINFNLYSKLKIHMIASLVAVEKIAWSCLAPTRMTNY